MKNLVIGVTDNFTWNQIRVWATSIKKSGFTGDVVLLGYRVGQDIVDGCESLGIDLYHIEHDDLGNPIDHHKDGLPTQSHKLRNFHIWQFLNQIDIDYTVVVVTDTRDVVFQRNPDIFLQSYLENGTIINPDELGVILPSESVLIENESWIRGLIIQHFGNGIYDSVKHHPAGNSGTMFGRTRNMKHLMLTMFLVGKFLPATGIDQPVVNVLAQTNSYITRLPMNDGWACQCGTVLDPSKSHFILEEPRPTIVNGVAYTSNNEQFVILHQYDRVPGLTQLIENKYL